MSEKQILFPVGRLVGGSVYRANPVTEDDGKTPKLRTDGTPRKSYSFAVAFAKTHGVDWKHTAWGSQVVQVGSEGFPNGEYHAPTFAWKVTDGDSPVPNKAGKKPVEQEGYPGNWVVWFSSEAIAPKLTDKYGTREGTLTYADGLERIKPGHMVEVLGFVKDNSPSKSPGVYMNYEMVAHNDATTPEIVLRQMTDSTKVGFGGAAPAANQAAYTPAPPANHAAYAPPAAPAQQYAPAAPAPAAPIAVVPNPAMLAPPPPVTPAGPRMLPAANGLTYEQYRAGGWTDEQMRANGVMA